MTMRENSGVSNESQPEEKQGESMNLEQEDRIQPLVTDSSLNRPHPKLCTLPTDKKPIFLHGTPVKIDTSVPWENMEDFEIRPLIRQMHQNLEKRRSDLFLGNIRQTPEICVGERQNSELRHDEFNPQPRSSRFTPMEGGGGIKPTNYVNRVDISESSPVPWSDPSSTAKTETTSTTTTESEPMEPKQDRMWLMEIPMENILEFHGVFIPMENVQLVNLRYNNLRFDFPKNPIFDDLTEYHNLLTFAPLSEFKPNDFIALTVKTNSGFDLSQPIIVRLICEYSVTRECKLFLGAPSDTYHDINVDEFLPLVTSCKICNLVHYIRNDQ